VRAEGGEEGRASRVISKKKKISSGRAAEIYKTWLHFPWAWDAFFVVDEHASAGICIWTADPRSECAVSAGVPARQRRERFVSCIYIVGFDNPEELKVGGLVI
jgi:hypothetical protein